MKRITLTALVLLLAGTLGASAGMNLTPPNADIRALEPPVDVTPEQLIAQGTLLPPTPAAAPYAHGVHVHYGHEPHHFHHHHKVY